MLACLLCEPSEEVLAGSDAACPEHSHLPRCLEERFAQQFRNNKKKLQSNKMQFVSAKEAANFAEEINALGVECSAFTGINVKELFDVIIRKTLLKDGAKSSRLIKNGCKFM